jgi:hypothetical protein
MIEYLPLFFPSQALIPGQSLVFGYNVHQSREWSRVPEPSRIGHRSRVLEPTLGHLYLKRLYLSGRRSIPITRHGFIIEMKLIQCGSDDFVISKVMSIDAY